MKQWIDETGREIPENRITKLEKKKEKISSKIVKEALNANKTLKTLKTYILEKSQEIFEQALAERDVKKERKGNFTWYNFDRSIKIEVNISEPVIFEDELIYAAKSKLFDFLKEKTDGVEEFVRDIILDAFETRNGQLDVKRIISLTKYRERVNDKRFDAACDLIIEAQRRPSTKKYFKIYVRDENGEYKHIELNISAI